MTRRAYVRPMEGWWARDPFFIRYMAREATALFVVVYAFTLLDGLVHLWQGRATFEAWVANLRGESAIGFHAVILAAFVYHTVTWFQIMPKTMPPIVIAGRALAPWVITACGLAASALASAALLVVLKGLA